MSKPRYEILTWDANRHKFTPQIGVRKGPYTLFGLRRAVRKLRRMNFDACRSDPSVLVAVRPAAKGEA